METVKGKHRLLPRHVYSVQKQVRGIQISALVRDIGRAHILKLFISAASLQSVELALAAPLTRHEPSYSRWNTRIVNANMGFSAKKRVTVSIADGKRAGCFVNSSIQVLCYLRVSTSGDTTSSTPKRLTISHCPANGMC